jgi:subtilisin family serine protease
LAGINWILQRIAAHPETRAVINMSFGGAESSLLINAVQSLVNAGAVVVVAAGNDAADACQDSPAGAPAAFAVGAFDSTSVWASFSNFGNCVRMNAPGVAVTSDWIGSPTATNVLSGTSMASPIVAGTAALVWQAFPNITPLDVTTTLQVCILTCKNYRFQVSFFFLLQYLFHSFPSVNPHQIKSFKFQ